MAPFARGVRGVRAGLQGPKLAARGEDEHREPAQTDASAGPHVGQVLQEAGALALRVRQLRAAIPSGLGSPSARLSLPRRRAHAAHRAAHLVSFEGG